MIPAPDRYSPNYHIEAYACANWRELFRVTDLSDLVGGGPWRITQGAQSEFVVAKVVFTLHPKLGLFARVKERYWPARTPANGFPFTIEQAYELAQLNGNALRELAQAAHVVLQTMEVSPTARATLVSAFEEIKPAVERSVEITGAQT